MVPKSGQLHLMLAQKCAECRPDAFQMQVPTPNAGERAGTGECPGGGDLMGEEIPVYQARGQTMLYRRQSFAGMGSAGAKAPMRQGGHEGSGKRWPGGVGAV